MRGQVLPSLQKSAASSPPHTRLPSVLFSQVPFWDIYYGGGTTNFKKRKRLTRDQSRDILLLRKTGKTYSEIATFLGPGVSEYAVQYTCNTQKATPKKDGRGRPSKLSMEQLDELIVYVRQSKDTRRMTNEELGEVFHVHKDCIKRAVNHQGYHRRVALRKPPISEKNRQARLA